MRVLSLTYHHILLQPFVVRPFWTISLMGRGLLVDDMSRRIDELENSIASTRDSTHSA